MSWDWSARGAMPATSTGSGTTTGGSIGSAQEASVTAAWPRYEADYLKRALQSDRYKYNTDGLDAEQKAVYLDRVVADYKAEADQCLKAEFDEWLVGNHAANSGNDVYENCDGKPVRRWMFRTKDAEDETGATKVGQARAGWKHTPWGRAPLTHLPGVRDYLRTQKEAADSKDRQMQLLAEYGPQNIDQAWQYFKHWVKGRPLTDAVTLQPAFSESVERANFNMQPERMYAYDPDPPDRQPGVLASDHNAQDAAVAPPGSKHVQITSPHENANVQEARALRERLEEVVATGGLVPCVDSEAPVKIEEAARKLEHRDDIKQESVDRSARHERDAQKFRQEGGTAPVLPIVPDLS